MILKGLQVPHYLDLETSLDEEGYHPWLQWSEEWDLICGISSITSCKTGKLINGADKLMQHRFFSRMLALIKPCFHSDAVTDNASRLSK